ncbi:spermidine/putrescine ABC transporter permease [Bacillus sp. T3]|uniref:ABC transporter permease n=1 Tax=Bacillus sp. T3 TaxID=467262 RepID=UPI002981FCBA|nr:spermidine/putrescine ABC transporter permease [Bacillus sp. T3]
MERLAILKKIPIWLYFSIVSFFLVLPFLSIIIWSFTKLWPWPALIPDVMNNDSWTYLFSPSGKAVVGLINSVTVAFITVFGCVALGLPAARILSQKQFFGKGFVFITLLCPLFIPLTVSVMGLYDVTIRLKFLNEYLCVAIAHILVTLPYFIAMVAYQYKLLGLSQQEAARSLEAGFWQIIFWIELPQILPALLLSCLFVIIISFCQYLPTWIMSGGTLLTLPLIIFPFASSSNTSMVSAYSIWLFIPIMAFVLVYFLLLAKLHHRKEGVKS